MAKEGSRWQRFTAFWQAALQDSYRRDRFRYWTFGPLFLASGPILFLSAVLGWGEWENASAVALIALAWTILSVFILTLLLRNREVTHDVVVMHVSPDGQDPYFSASCECGWHRGPEEGPEVLFAEARKHTPNVRPEVETRP
jgi:hypothetical protein